MMTITREDWNEALDDWDTRHEAQLRADIGPPEQITFAMLVAFAEGSLPEAEMDRVRTFVIAYRPFGDAVLHLSRAHDFWRVMTTPFPSDAEALAEIGAEQVEKGVAEIRERVQREG